MSLKIARRLFQIQVEFPAKRLYYLLVMLHVLCMPAVLHAQSQWPQFTKEMKPWTRWWWMGSAVDTVNLKQELHAFQEAGFGGVEITPIYGAKGYEDKYVPFLSPQWASLLRYTAKEATDLGLGVDMNLGTGWPFGGPEIHQEHAATKLVLQEYTFNADDTLYFPLKPNESKDHDAYLQAIRAFDNRGKEYNLDHLIKAGTATWKAPTDVLVLAMFAGRTKQRVKRAAPGGEGYTVDHLGKENVEYYFEKFNHFFSQKPIPIRGIFNDSYEVYGADWTDEYLAIFEQKKGYRLQDHLYDLSGKSGNKQKQAELKGDYRQVLNELLKSNFLRPFTGLAHQHGMISRNQAHGSPGNLIDLYASTDIAECETFGSSEFAIPGLRREKEDVRNVDPDPMMFKFASSATNVTGKRYTSSETFTWLTEHFKTALSQMKPEVEQLFLSGVNHVIYHGSTYSPKEVDFPGWLFYASTNFVPHNPIWQHIDGLNTYVTHVQSILQTTKADHDILIYWPIHDIWNDAEGMMRTLSVHHVDKWLHPTEFYKESIQLQDRGYGFDFISDSLLSNATVKNGQILTATEANPYKAIYVPATTYMPEQTLYHLLQLAEAGATVIFQKLPLNVPGFGDKERRQHKLNELIKGIQLTEDMQNQYVAIGEGKLYLTEDVYSALETENIFGEHLVRTGLRFTRRISGQDSYYYMTNHGSHTIDEFIRLNRNGKQYTLLDPQSGKVYSLPDNDDLIRIQIEPGYAWIIKVSEAENPLQNYQYKDQLVPLDVFHNEWTVTFHQGGPAIPKSRKIVEPSAWTTWDDPLTAAFAGVGTYETSFELNEITEGKYLLKLGEVGESARVIVNGKPVGPVWSHPFQIDITGALHEGQNHLQIEVANLMANRMKELDKQGVVWKNYHEINFVNIDYENFDASKWSIMRSGLIGPVQLFHY